MSEIASISNITHPNLVKLHGGCIDGPSKLLVYDYMENNSLAQFLLGGEESRTKLSWETAIDFDLQVGEFFLVQKAWEMYKSNKLVQLVDPALNKTGFSEREVDRFLRVGLICVQQKCGLRPYMSTAIKMMHGEVDVRNSPISDPGLITNIMDVKIGNRRSRSSSFTKMSSPRLQHS
ncbi:hypothetical protein V6N11_054011 [Hibiscus sabdariffa]|uniref:Serine-threonine/tyrosine-protein kinase catalytic domain-containing protein n=1 Tax=Hibiscus sabdariffa TaxID=183260 RepID=A0ABR2S381_9ROSI